MILGETFDRLRAAWAYARYPDPLEIDIGREGEVFTARLRIFLISVVLLFTIKTLFTAGSGPEDFIGLATVSGALLVSVWFERLAIRSQPPVGLAWWTSQFDVLAVSLSSVGFIVGGHPLVATNNFVVFCIYLLSISATALRANPLVSITAGLSATLQHLIVVVIVAHRGAGIRDPFYGYFDWNTQIGRLIILILATALATALVMRNRTYWRSSIRDKLTGLHNRRFFDEFLEYRLELAAKTCDKFYLVYFDLDHFKSINDRYGHAQGDKVLVEVGRVLNNFCGRRELACRHGGEEFAILITGSDNQPADTARRLEDLRQGIEGVPAPGPVSASFGVAEYPRDGQDAKTLMAKADTLMYAAKDAGRNRVVGLS